MIKSDPYHRRSLEHLREAGDELNRARYNLGNDHPAYDELTRLMDDVAKIEELY